VITEAASRGEISSDQQVVLSRLASAASDAMWAKAAAGLSVRQLEVAVRRQAITTKGAARPSRPRASRRRQTAVGGFVCVGARISLRFTHPSGRELVTHPPPFRPEVIDRLL
jgi:hypothetical protein